MKKWTREQLLRAILDNPKWAERACTLAGLCGWPAYPSDKTRLYTPNYAIKDYERSVTQHLECTCEWKILGHDMDQNGAVLSYSTVYSGTVLSFLTDLANGFIELDPSVVYTDGQGVRRVQAKYEYSQ